MKLEDVVTALHMTDDFSRGYYDHVTHEIVWLDEYGMTREEYEAAAETLDEHGSTRLPTREDIDEYGMLRDFTEAHPSPELECAIDGRGAFRRFKNTVRRQGLEQEWYRFREEQYVRVAREWCEECGIELEDKAPEKVPG